MQQRFINLEMFDFFNLDFFSVCKDWGGGFYFDLTSTTSFQILGSPVKGYLPKK